MPFPPRPLPPPIADRPFAVDRTGAEGVTRARLRAADIVRPHRGVAVRSAGSLELAMRAQSALCRKGPPAVISHATAAALRRLPLPLRFQNEAIHVTVAAPARAPHGRGIVGHSMSLHESDVETLGCTGSVNAPVTVPVLTLPTLLLTLTTCLRPHDLVAVVDAARFATSNDVIAVHPRAQSTSHPSEVWTASDWRDAIGGLIERRRGERGTAMLRDAWRASESGVRSRPESLLRLAILGAGLPMPVVGHRVEGSGWSATPDLAWPEWKVLAEYEGEHHRTSAGQFEHDLRRFERFGDEGWSCVRVVRPDLFHNPMPMVLRLASRLQRAGWRPSRGWRPRSVGAFAP